MRLKAYLAATFAVILLALALPGAALWSTSGAFNATVTVPLYINWTTGYNGTITLGNNISSSVILNVLNSTSDIKNSTSHSAPFSVYGWNGTHYALTNLINLSAFGINDTTTSFRTAGLAAGRYTGNLTINNGTVTENITINTILDIPIAFAVTAQGAAGNFSGNVSNESSEIYWFNASSVGGVVGIRLNLTSISGNNATNFSTLPIAMVPITLNSSSNTTEGICKDCFFTGYYNLTAISANGTDPVYFLFDASLELLKASLWINATPAWGSWPWTNGTADTNISDNIPNITIKDNLGFAKTYTLAGLNISNFAGYDLIIANITLAAPNSKAVTKAVPVNITNLTSGQEYIVEMIGSNATHAFLNITNLTGYEESFNVSEGGTFVTDDGTRARLTLLLDGVAAIVFGDPVTRTSNLTSGVNFINYTIGLGNLTVFTNSSNATEINITTKANNTEGLYSGWLLVHSSNGYPSRALKLALFVNLTRELLVSINNIRNASNQAQMTVPGANVTINITPRYQNGTTVAGLGRENFEILYAVHQDADDLINDNFQLSVVDAARIGDDYIINSSKIPQSALGGNYTLGLFVKDNATAGLNNATAIGNLTIYETALHLGELGGTRCGPGSSYTISIGTIVKCRPKITNYGAKAASSVNVSLSGCPKLTKYAGPGNLVQLGDIGPGSSNYSDFWRFNATESGTCTLTINASAAGTAWDRQSFTVTFNISASTAAPGDELPEETLTKGLAITSYPAELQIEQGKSKTVNVKVKNTGNVTLGDVSLAVEEIEATWWRTAPSTTVLTANEEKSFAVTFSIPDNATVANYPIAYKAEATGISATKSASLVVLPGPVAQQEINISLANYTARYEALLAELNAAYAAGGNVTEAESKLALVKELLDRAEASIEAGDYFAANALLAQIKAALDDAEVAIAAIEMPEKELPWSWLWVGAAAAIIAIIAVYMLWRRPGYYPGIGYRRPAFKIRIAELIQKFKKKFRKKAA